MLLKITLQASQYKRLAAVVVRNVEYCSTTINGKCNVIVTTRFISLENSLQQCVISIVDCRDDVRTVTSSSTNWGISELSHFFFRNVVSNCY